MSWINLQMMLQDLPWYDYDSDKEEKTIEVKPEDELKVLARFAK